MREHQHWQAGVAGHLIRNAKSIQVCKAHRSVQRDLFSLTGSQDGIAGCELDRMRCKRIGQRHARGATARRVKRLNQTSVPSTACLESDG
jgi:hypothetical protein